MADKFTKNEIVGYISTKTGVNKKDVKKVLDEFFTFTKDFVLAGNEVVIHGFGRFAKKTIRRPINDYFRNKGENVPAEITVESITFRPSRKVKIRK